MKRAKFGPGGNSALFNASGNRSSQRAPEWVLQMELDAYEYECGNGVSASEETLLEIGLNAHLNGVATSLHSPYYISLSSIDESKRANSVKYIMQSLKAARDIGANIIVVHAGGTNKLERRDAMDLAAKTLEQTIEMYQKQDFCGIKIGLETMGKINQLGTLDEIIELCKIDSIFAPVVDFGHLYARSLGNDVVSPDDIERIFDKISHSLGSETAENLHCHYSCIEFSKGGELRHLTFDNGKYGPDPVMFAKTIAKLGVTPTVICESAGTQDVDARILKTAYLEAL